MNNTNSAVLDHDASLTLCGRDIVQPISIFYSLKISVSGWNLGLFWLPLQPLCNLHFPLFETERKFSMMKLTPYWTRPPPIGRGAPWQQALSPRENRSPSAPCGAHLPRTPITHTPQLPECVFGGQNTHTHTPPVTPLRSLSVHSVRTGACAAFRPRGTPIMSFCCFQADTGSRRNNSQ